jgi:tRNA(adenine34) deaminase
MDEGMDRCGFGPSHKIDRRQTLAALFGPGIMIAAMSAPHQVSASVTQVAPLPGDEHFMRMALAEAEKGDFPFGAVIIRDGKILAKGRNLGRTTDDLTAHGEMVAIRRFVSVRPVAELKGTTLYTSGEPCPMCMGAILWSGIGRVVFAASIEELATEIGQIMLSSRTVADAAPFANIAITGGILSAEALALFRS